MWPMGAAVSIAVAAALYADDIDSCNNTYIKCR